MTNPFTNLTPSERQERLNRQALPYEFADNVKILKEEALQTFNDVSDLLSDACPEDTAQISITMHPNFSSRDFYPEEFLHVMKLSCVGVRQVQVFPRQSFDVESDDGELTVSLIAVGKRADIQKIPETLELIVGDTLVGAQIQTIESIEAVSIYDRTDVPNDYFGDFFLVGQYQTPGKTVHDSRADFESYALKHDFKVHPTFIIEKNGLFYLLLKGDRYKLDAIGDYCYTFIVRVPPRSVS